MAPKKAAAASKKVAEHPPFKDMVEQAIVTLVSPFVREVSSGGNHAT